MKSLLNVIGAVSWLGILLVAFVAGVEGSRVSWATVGSCFTTGLLAFFGAAVLERLDTISALLTKTQTEKAPVAPTAPASSTRPADAEVDVEQSVKIMRAALSMDPDIAAHIAKKREREHRT